ncbi:MAG: hypothetical protein GY702_06515 [Desulfobulbaceae bacterium]|nr:hypothetical protein [Desulfobulbaceae bacterium]
MGLDIKSVKTNKKNHIEVTLMVRQGNADRMIAARLEGNSLGSFAQTTSIQEAFLAGGTCPNKHEEIHKMLNPGQVIFLNVVDQGNHRFSHINCLEHK